MKKSLIQVIILLVASVVFTLFAEYYDEHRLQTQQKNEIHHNLVDIQQQLQQRLDILIAQTQRLAQRLTKNPDAFFDPEGAGILADIVRPASVVNYSFARGYDVEAVYPYEGNEAVLGVNYRFHPDFLPAIQRAIVHKGTVISSRVTLLQTDHLGFIIRSPVFSPDGEYIGIVSTAVDLDVLLREVGYRKSLGFNLLIRAKMPHRAPQMLMGSFDNFIQLPEGVEVKVPEKGIWQLRGQPIVSQSNSLLQRNDVIRLVSASITFVVLMVFLWRKGLLQGLAIGRRRLTLRLALLVLTILPMLVLLIILEALNLRSVWVFSQQQLERQAAVLTRQVQAQVEDLFDVPRQATFHIELFRQGLLDVENTDEMLGFFVSQLRIQPSLSFLAFANLEGEYYAASRAPLGKDRNIRIQWANLDTDREIRLHWVDDSNRPSEDFVRGNPDYDARRSGWFRHALESRSMQWYPIHRYRTADTRQQFKGLGIGVSAPVFSPENRLIGVFAADIALAQLSEFLHEQSLDFGGTLFLTERDGSLVATSTDDPLYLDQAVDIIRLTASDSTNPLLRLAGATIQEAGTNHGRKLIHYDGQMQLLSWHSLDIHDGPDLLLGVMIPPKALASATDDIWRNALYMAWLLLVFGTVLIFFSTSWVSQPLQALEHWASKLRKGRWDEPMPSIGPIDEVRSLSNSLEQMSQQLRSHTQDLEQQVQLRTEELRHANKKLKRLSITDGLTGLVNRRYLDERSRVLWGLAQRQELPMGVLMVDVDYFKKYNDYYGHQAGDVALERVARALTHFARRATDIVGRYGGEEFALLYVDMSEEEVHLLAQQIVVAIRALDIEHLHSPFGEITVSVGVAHTVPQADSHVEILFQQADKALYQAKADGRNQVCLYQNDG